MFGRKKKKKNARHENSSGAVAPTQEIKKNKARLSTKIFFWLFIALAILAAFLFWSSRSSAFINEKSPVGINLSILSAIIATLLSIFFAMICFIRFIRSRSIAGGLFLTTAISTAVFLGASQLIGVIIPPTANAFSQNPEATGNGVQVVIGLAQVGLFALWFFFLLLTIFVQVSPVKKIDKYLQRIVDGEDVRKVRIGKARQYRGIEHKLRILSDEQNERLEREEHRREKAAARREKRKKELQS